MSPALLPIFLIVLVDVLGLTFILPLLPFYAEGFGATPFQVGLLTTVFAFCQLFSGPILGALSDRTGRKPLLLVSQAGTLVGFAILAGATTLPIVFLSRAIDGATAGNLSLAQAYIADVTAPKDRAKAFAVIGIAFGIGFLIGPAASGILAHYNYHYPIYAAMGLSALSIVATATLLPSVKPTGDASSGPGGRRPPAWKWSSYAPHFEKPQLRSALLQIFCFFLAFTMFTSGFALFAERRLTTGGRPFGPREVGLIFGYAGLLGIFIQGGMVGRLVRRFGELKVARMGFLSSAAAYTGLSFVFKVPFLLLSATFSSFGNGVLRPALTSLVSKSASPREQGLVLGFSQSLNSIAAIIAPLVGGALIEHEQTGLWALCMAVLCCVGLFLGRSHPAQEAAAQTTA